MVLSVYEILERISKIEDHKERYFALRNEQHNNVLKEIVRLAYSKSVRWNLPLGAPPYKPNESVESQGVLYNQIRKMHLFLDTPESNKLDRLKRESLYIQLLESVDPKDALLLLAIKDGRLPFKNLNPNVCMKAFPGLIDV